jgi:hypothetical protein
MRIATSFLISLLLFQLPLLAQRKKNTDKEPVQQETPKPKNGMKSYSEIVTRDAKTDIGLFTVHNVNGNYLFEISDSLLNREILVVSRISGTIEGFNFGGAGMKARGQQVLRWQKKDDLLLLRSVSHNSVASNETPIYESVRNNNFEPIIMSFEIKALSKDSSAYIIEVNELFTTDVPMIGPLNADRRKDFGIRSLDKKRSMVMWMKSFPLNTEIRHILTFEATQLPSNENTNSLSIEMNQSMVLLPRKPMMARNHDRRVGYFSVRQIDYGLDEQKAAERRFVTRWRLEPKDMEAFKRGELVEPKKQIVYYIDPATPSKWRNYIKQGVNDWNIAFEKAGFKNAITAKDPPSNGEDPDWSPEDVRYSVIRYTANPIQNAQGPHVHDPRSGEILESDIIWYHNVMNLLRNWYFVQTAAVNPLAQKVKFEDEVMGRLIRFVSAHEVGHTLGLQHNMGASYSYPVDSLRSPAFTATMGTAPSIMDYARFNYVAQPGDNAALLPQIGVYDKWAIEWAYKPIPEANSSYEENETLNSWIMSHENDQMYWFGQSSRSDPRAQTEDLGNNSMQASSYGIANLKRIVPNLIRWTSGNGKNYDDLDELYNQVVNQWNRYNGHVRNNVGGLYETHKTYDQNGQVYSVPAESLQKEAMAWLHKETFATPVWILNEEVMGLVSGSGMMERVRSLQVATLNQLLSVDRMLRVSEAGARNNNQTYTLLEMMQDLREGLWSELATAGSIDAYRRNLQRAYLDRMGWLLENQESTSEDLTQSDIRPIARGELKVLRSRISSAISRIRDTETRYHLEDAIVRIDHILDPK